MNKSPERKQLHDLLQSIINKDPQIVESLVNEHTLPLMKVGLGLGFSSEQAEDLVQSVWIVFFQNPEKFEQKSELRTYLFGILYNKARELRRANQKYIADDRIEDLLNESFDSKGHWSSHLVSPDKMMEASETLNLIKKCLDGLPTSQRLAFYLREVEDYSSKEICKILDVSITNIGVLLFRAKAGLRYCLEFKIKS